MYAVMGVTGKVGGAVARSLLAQGAKVRVIVRESVKASQWVEQGCEASIADLGNPQALTQAFKGTNGVFVMLPPTFDPGLGFPEARASIENLRSALQAAMPAKVLALSTIGGQVERPNLLSQLHLLEAALSSLRLPVTFLRPGWFIENSSWDIAPAQKTGVISSFLQPLDKAFPMIATRDIGEVAAELLLEQKETRGVVEIEGPSRISPNEIAAAISLLLKREVRTERVPREDWESLFLSQGMKNPAPRIQMLDGFNEGWIEFEAGQQGSRKTHTSLLEALETLIRPVHEFAA